MNITNTTMNLGVVTINNTHYMAILHYKDENGADCPVPDHVRKASNVALKLFEDVLEQYSNQGAVTRVDEAGFFNRESRIAPHTSEAWETFVRHLEYPNVPGATLGLGGVEIGDKPKIGIELGDDAGVGFPQVAGRSRTRKGKSSTSIRQDANSRILNGRQVAVDKPGANGQAGIFGAVAVPIVHPGGGGGVVGEEDFTGYGFPVGPDGEGVVQDVSRPARGGHLSGDRAFDGALPQEIGGDLEIAGAIGKAAQDIILVSAPAVF